MQDRYMSACAGGGGDVSVRECMYCRVELFIRFSEFRISLGASKVCYIQVSNQKIVWICNGSSLQRWTHSLKELRVLNEPKNTKLSYKPQLPESLDSTFIKVIFSSEIFHRTMLFCTMYRSGGVRNTLRHLAPPRIRHTALAYFSSSASERGKLTAEQVVVCAPAKYDVPGLKEVCTCVKRNSAPALHIMHVY